MTDVALRDEGLLARVQRTSTSLILPPDFPYDEYEELIALLGSIENACIWWSADLLRQGEHLYGEDVAQAAELLGRAPQTIINRVSVANRVPPAQRNPNVTFSCHAEVAALEPREQVRWLGECEQQGWKRDELRAAIRGSTNATTNGRVEVLSPTPSIEEAARWVVQAGRRAVGDVWMVPAEPYQALREAVGV